MQPFRIGIVGYGLAGRGFHAPLIRRVPGLAITAVATRDPSRQAQAAAELGCATFPSLEAMLEAQACTVVVLATPHDVHAAQAEAAMAAGRHVVVDKPFTITTAEADRLIRARDRAGVLLTAFHNRRWDWDYTTIKRLIGEGAVGNPYALDLAVLRHKPPRGWRDNEAVGGGLMYDWGAHLVDQALQLVPGPLASVSADVQRRGWGKGAGSYARLLLRFASGVLVGIEIGNMAAIAKPRWFVLGDLGAITKTGLDPQEAALLGGDIAQAKEDPANRARLVNGDGESITETDRADWTDFYVNLRHALAGQAPLAVTAEEARRVIAVLEAATQSAATGQPVLLET